MSYTLVPSELIVDGAITSAKLDTNISISGTLGVTGEVTLATHLNMGDNDKIKIGAGGDLEIYHDGSNSYIANSTGNIYIADTNGAVHIQAKLNEESIVASADGAVTLYHDNSAKLATASGGVTVTGTLTATTLAGTLSTAAQTNITSVGTLTGFTSTGIDDNADATAITIDSSENVGIGDTSPHSFGTNQSGLTISDGTGGCIRLKNDAGTVNFDIENGGGAGIKLNSVNAFPLIFATNDTERMRIDSSGNLLIGATSTNTGAFGSVSPQLLIAGTQPQLLLHESDTDKDGYIGIASSIMFIQTADAIPMRFGTSDAERMRIASNGSIGMGTTPPSDTHTGWTQLFIGQKGSVISENATGVHGLDGTFVTDNMYVDSDTGAFAYIEANESSAYRQEAGNHQFFTHASSSAGAAVTLSEKMRIASDGKVGIGESAPANAKLEVLQAGDHDAHSTHGIAIHSTGNTNFTSMYMGCEDAIDSAYIQSVALDGSFTSKSLLLNANGGQVRLGSKDEVDSNCTALHTKATASTKWVQAMSGVDRGMVVYSTLTSGTTLFHYFIYNGSVVGSISSTGSSTAYNTTSDARLKDVTGSARGLEVINKLNPVSYNWKVDGKADEGLIAQEVEPIVPNAITYNEESDIYNMDYSKLVTPLIKAIQEQQAVIEELKTRIETLEG